MFESGNDPVENRIAKQVRVVALLEKHFPDIDADRVAETAEHLMTAFTVWQWFQSQSAGNRAPSTDQEALRKAAKHLEKAATELANLNAAGNEALYHFAQEVVTKDLGLTSPYMLEGENAKIIIAGQIGSIAKRLTDVSEMLGPGTRTPLYRLGQTQPRHPRLRSNLEVKPYRMSGVLRRIRPGLRPQLRLYYQALARLRSEKPSYPKPRKGRPEKLAAAEIGREVMEVFRDFTGKYPSKTVDPYIPGNPASGKILKFLSALFEILEIHASPESVFQQISKTKRQKEKKTEKPE